jgi:hypothetical protein
MYTFLILSSLAVGFYLVLLLALYRDGRKRRRATSPVIRKMSHVTVLEFDTIAPASSPGVAAPRRKSSAATIRFPASTFSGSSGSSPAAGCQVKLMSLSAAAPRKDGLKFS